MTNVLFDVAADDLLRSGFSLYLDMGLQNSFGLIYDARLIQSEKKSGDAGYRSRYLPHAKRALYHLSYTPVVNIASQHHIILIDMKIVV